MESQKRIYKKKKKLKSELAEEKLMVKVNNDFTSYNKNYWNRIKKTIKPRVITQVEINEAKMVFEELLNKQIVNNDGDSKAYPELTEFLTVNENKVFSYTIRDLDLINIVS